MLNGLPDKWKMLTFFLRKEDNIRPLPPHTTNVLQYSIISTLADDHTNK
jgi:hypothetical protein